MKTPFISRHISHGFYRLTPSQAKALCVDGKLPADGYAKRAKSPAELATLCTFQHQTRFARLGEWTDSAPLGKNYRAEIQRTPLSWHDGESIPAGWVWAIHVYETARSYPPVKPYPPKPEGAEFYQHGNGSEKPVALDRWEWSTTFGRWSRLVTFADGWHGFTYPQT